MKNDRYRRARGGKAFMVNILCSRCGHCLLYYQKDGDGKLKRCYLNRIFAPDKMAELQKGVQNPLVIPKLVCESCGTVIGSAIRHHDGRIAFRLRPDYYIVKRITKRGES